MSSVDHGLPWWARVFAAAPLFAALLATLFLAAALGAPPFLAALFTPPLLELRFAAFDAAIAALCGVSTTKSKWGGPRVAHGWPTSGVSVAHGWPTRGPL